MRALSICCLLALLCGCNTPMDASPLPAPRNSQLSAPVYQELSLSAPRIYLLDGNLLKARYADGLSPVWSRELGYFWHPQPVLGIGGRVYVITYDPDFPPDAPSYRLLGFSADGSALGAFSFNQQPTAPLVFSNGSLALGLSGENRTGRRSVSTEPAGSKLIVLSPELDLQWANSSIGDLLRTPVSDGSWVYAADASALHVFSLSGDNQGSLPAPDPNQTAQYAANELTGGCYGISGSELRFFDGLAMRWAVTLPAAALPDNLLANADGAYCLLTGGIVYAADAADGAQRWSLQLPAGSKYRLALSPAGLLYAASGGGGPGAEDLLLALDTAGSELWRLSLPERITAPLLAAGADGVLLTVSPQRAAQRSSLLQVSAGGVRLGSLSAGEVLPGFVINGQSTLNPPWPALQ